MKLRILVLIVSVLMLASACRSGTRADGSASPTAAVAGGEQAAASATLPPVIVATNTAIPPTPTPTEPLAALVNGQPIYLADYDLEVARFEAALNASAEAAAAAPADYRTQVLDALIERELIRQAASQAGVVVSDDMVAAKLAELRTAAAENGGLEAWLQANNYTEETFRDALRLEMITGEMVNRVTSDVPTAVEQVRARYIQMEDAALAQQVLDRARAGDDFAFLAQQNSVDRVTGANGGDLGFFAPGSLLVPEVEAAAFALQPGEISDVIAVPRADGTTAYYIIQVTERDPARTLTAEARHQLLQAAYDAWIRGLWDAATIERLVGAGS